MQPAGQVTEPPAFVRLAGHPLRWKLLGALADSDYRVRELVTRVGEPQNLVSYHLRLLRDGGLVTATRSSFDRRDSYYHLDLDRCAEALAATGAALHPALRRDTAPSTRSGGRRRAVLFVCTGNSARSPIAEALLRMHTAGRVTAASGGIRPKPRLHPHTARVLRDGFGVDITERRPRQLDTLTGRRFDHVITLCDKARESCPAFPDQPRQIHWSIADPASSDDGGETSYLAFQHAASEIDTRIRHLIPTLDTSHRTEVQP